MPATELAYAICIMFVASVIRGLTGFGFSAIIVTGLSIVIPPTQPVVLALILEILASIQLLPSVWKSIKWKLLAALCAGTAIGTPLGVSILAWLEPATSRFIISCIVFIFAILIWKGYSYSGPRNIIIDSTVGLISGICNGAAALGGLPVVTFLLSTDTGIAAIRATLIAAFFCTDVYAILFAGGHGLVTSTTYTHVLASIPFLVIGLWTGKKLFSVASPAMFKKVALAILVTLSIVGLIKSVLHWL